VGNRVFASKTAEKRAEKVSFCARKGQRERGKKIGNFQMRVGLKRHWRRENAYHSYPKRARPERRTLQQIQREKGETERGSPAVGTWIRRRKCFGSKNKPRRRPLQGKKKAGGQDSQDHREREITTKQKEDEKEGGDEFEARQWR